MNLGRTLRRTVRPIWVAGLVATAWANRRQLRGALGFGKPADGGHAVGDTLTIRTTTATWADPRRHFHRRTTVPGHAGTPVPVGPSPAETPSHTHREASESSPEL